MLTRSSVVARRTGGAIFVATVAAALMALFAAPVAVAASDPVDCPPEQTVCTLQVERPAQPNTVRPAAHAASGNPACRIPAGQAEGGTPVPCHAPGFGWWSNADGCYYQPVQPQPARTDPVWEGRTSGAIYEVTCPGVPGTGGGWVWRAAPPAGGGAGVEPAVLAQRAVRELALQGPAIGMAPPADAMGLVHVPVWLWTAVTPATWGPVSVTATVPGLSVTAVARAVTVTWDMGDGHVVTCHGPGTPYRPDLPVTTSPTCGHVYERSSAGRPGDAYPVTAATTWQVTWSGGGQTGALTVTRTSRTSVRVGEMQALT